MAKKIKSPKNNTRLILFILFIFVAIDIFFIYWYRNSNQNTFENTTKQTNQKTSDPSLERASSDGTMVLKMKTEKAPDSNKKYSFTVFDPAKKTESLLFENTVGAQTSLVMPENSWSPDNKILFIQVNEPGAMTYLVFKANGEAFAQDQKYLDVGVLFQKKLPKYTMVSATGWASETLMIISTKTLEGAKGPNFWFDTTSSAFIQLAS